MKNRQEQFCGKDLRKYLYVIGFISVLVLIGSYWYMNFFLKGQGFRPSSETAAVNGQAIVAQPLTAGPVALQTPSFRPPGMVNIASRSPFTSVASALKYSVVNISAMSTGDRSGVITGEQLAPPPGRQLRFAEPFAGQSIESIGSGVIVDSTGYILTNFHVVENASEIFVTIPDPRGNLRFQAQVVELGETVDLALLKIDAGMELTPAALGSTESLMVGDQVLAVGSPFGLDQTVSQGIISGMRKTMVIEGVTHANLLQTDAAINQGNSGGPLVDMQGYVVGINTAIYTPTGAFAGVGFAVPSDAAIAFLDELITLPEIRPNLKKSFKNGRAMNAAANVAPPPIMANSVPPHGDRGTCESCHQIFQNGGNANMGASNSFASGSLGRGASGVNIATIQTQQPAYFPATTQGGGNLLGFDVQPMGGVVAANFKPSVPTGVFVSNVYPGTQAEQGGLAAGDFIFKVDGQWIDSPEKLVAVLQGVDEGEITRLSVEREGKKLDLFIKGLSLGQGNGQTRAVMPAGIQQSQGNFQMAAATVPGLPNEYEWMGMEILPVTPSFIAKRPDLSQVSGRALVGEVSPNSAAMRAGVQADDIILSINKMAIDSHESLNVAINSISPQGGILFEVLRNQKRIYLILS